MTFKEKVFRHYKHLLHDKMEALQKVLAELKESGSNETKSTAGDKHETALVMLQIEQANKRTQLAELQAQLVVLEKINPNISPAVVVTGSLIKTNRGYFFMSVALGKAMFDEVHVIALSPQSPLGQKLMGLAVGDHIVVNNTRYELQELS